MAPSIRRLRRDLEVTAIMSSNAHPVTSDQFLREVIDAERNGEKHQAYHEKGTVMRAPAHHFAHFLRDDSRHGVDRLKDRAETLAKIRNCDPIPGAKEHDHGFADDTAEPEEDRGDDAGERRRDQDTRDGLEPVRTQRVGGLLETARDVTQGILSQRKNRRDRHEGEQAAGGKNVQALADGEEGYPLEPGGLRGGPDELADNRDSEKSEDHRRDGGDELNVRLDESFLVNRGDFAHVNR